MLLPLLCTQVEVVITSQKSLFAVLKFNRTQDSICVQKVEGELIKKWNFRQYTWFPWNRGPFRTYRILILRCISIDILAINTKWNNSNEYSKVSRRVSNNILSRFRVPLINNANYSLVFIRFELYKKKSEWLHNLSSCKKNSFLTSSKSGKHNPVYHTFCR